MGVEELAEDDKYFLEINLEDMETTSVEEEKTASLPYKLHERQG